MSFSRHKTHVSVGDTVLVYISPKQMYPLKVKENEVYQTRFGALKHDSIIGRQYGCKVDCTKGFVHILDMTPELWTVTLPHRTQILYGPDISFILIQLELKPGSVVVEAGTGSGSLSHCIARTIVPTGHLYTFDFHLERAMAARQEFLEHKLDSIITTQHRDVCTDGFGIEQPVDAVFLDLPHPWEALSSADSILKSGGRICCFSPCIEQVQRSCLTLAKLNFMDIETYECVLRPYEVRDLNLKVYKPDNTSQTKCNGPSESETPDLDDYLLSDEPCEEESNDFDSNCKKIRLDETAAATVVGKQSASDASSTTDYTITYMNSEIAGHTGFLTFATKFVTNIDTCATADISDHLEE